MGRRYHMIESLKESVERTFADLDNKRYTHEEILAYMQQRTQKDWDFLMRQMEVLIDSDLRWRDPWKTQ